MPKMQNLCSMSVICVLSNATDPENEEFGGRLGCGSGIKLTSSQPFMHLLFMFSYCSTRNIGKCFLPRRDRVWVLLDSMSNQCLVARIAKPQ